METFAVPKSLIICVFVLGLLDLLKEEVGLYAWKNKAQLV
jgi:hypothetical protein